MNRREQEMTIGNNAPENRRPVATCPRCCCSLALLLVLLGSVACRPAGEQAATTAIRRSALSESLQLPEPSPTGRRSLEETLATRRSVREFTDESLSSREISQLLWAAQGITHPQGLRTAPSAGALYPLEIYVATATGCYHYRPQRHALDERAEADLRREIYGAALQQEAILNAPVVFVITGVYERTARKYGPARTPRYVHLEAGHAAQNLLLQAVALDLGGVTIGAFDDQKLGKLLGLPSGETPLYVIPVGYPQDS